jgi:hypothetical protein
MASTNRIPLAMRPLLPFVLLTALSMGCAKDAAEVAQEVGLLPSTCGTDGARLQATAGGGEFCASAQVHAMGDGASVMISGFDLTGASLVVQVDMPDVGSHPIDQASNPILYTHAGAVFGAGSDTAGELVIELHDEIARRIKGSFDADLINVQNGEVRTVRGSFDVGYTIQR